MTIISLVSLTGWGIAWALLGGSHWGLSQDFSQMVAELESSPICPADDAGCWLGSQLGVQAATPTLGLGFLTAQWQGSETEKPKRTRWKLLRFHDLALEVAWLLHESEAFQIQGERGKTSRQVGG